tara:strand:- start:745 stop:1593 length:849 start_codon:yes stop_codon:yes gene_type:complete
MSNAHIKSGDVITVHVNGKLLTITKAHVNYYLIDNELKSYVIPDWDQIEKWADVSGAVEEWAQGVFKVVGGVLHMNGKEVHSALGNRIIQGIHEGADVTAFLNFALNLNRNPSKTAVDELFLFLEDNNLPITFKGKFQAYKNVNDNYKDRHSNSFDNQIGKVCEVARNEVDDVRDRTCSYGLHFCSLPYLRNFWGFNGHTMIVEIDPADVVSIPSDYNNTKGRTCKYTVVGELKQGHEDNYTEKAVVDYTDDEYVDWEEELRKARDIGYNDGYDTAMEDSSW